jgi:hypothetical protein
MDGLRLAIKKYHVLGIGLGFVFFIMYGSYALAFWYGCQLLLADLLTPGDVFTVFFSVLVGAFSLGNAVPYVATVGIAQGQITCIHRSVKKKILCLIQVPEQSYLT